jgi:hypothetical protein
VDTHSPQGITRNSGQPLASSNPHWWTPTAPTGGTCWMALLDTQRRTQHLLDTHRTCWTPIAALRAPPAHWWPPTAYALGYEAIVDTHCGRQSWTPAVVRVVRGYRLASMEAFGGVSPQTHCLVVHVLQRRFKRCSWRPTRGCYPGWCSSSPNRGQPPYTHSTYRTRGTYRTTTARALPAPTGGHPPHPTVAPARHPTRYSAHPLPTRGHPARAHSWTPSPCPLVDTQPVPTRGHLAHDHAQTPTARLLASFVSFVDPHGGSSVDGSSVDSHRAATTSFAGIHCGPRGPGTLVCAHLRFHGRQSGKTLTAAVGRTGRPWTPKVFRGHPRLVVPDTQSQPCVDTQLR